MIRSVTNPLLLFLAVWATAVGLYVAGVCAGTFPVPGPALPAVVLLNVGGFSLGYLTWVAFRQRLSPVELGPATIKVLTRRRIVRMLQLTGLMGLLALALAVHRTAVIASSLGMSVRELMANPAMLRAGFATFVTAGAFETNWIVMLSSVTNAVFSIGFVLLGVLLHVDPGRRKYVYVSGFLLIALAIGLTSVSRYEATVNIMYMVFAYGVVRGLDRRGATGRRLLTLLLPLVAVAAMFFMIDLLLHKSADYDQPTHLQGFLYHGFWYIASPLAAFNELLTTFDGHHHLGQYTFFPLYKWLTRFHLAPETDISVFGDFVLIPYAANVYTYLRNFYEDFGMAGVLMGPYVLGWVVSALRTRAATYFPYLNLYVMLLVFILFSFYNYALFSNQVYLQILFGFLFFRYALPGGNPPACAERLFTGEHSGAETVSESRPETVPHR